MNTAFTPWQDSCSTITSAFKHMLNNEIIVDAVFKKDKTSCLYAHKLVLSMWSPKFADWIAERDKREMFSITFEEDVDVLKLILEYLYSPDDVNCFLKLPLEKLIQALEISERYGINHVYKKCLSSLRRKKINPSNVIDYYDYGLRKNFSSIILKCIKVLRNEGFNTKHNTENISATTILHLLSLDKIAMNSEADLLTFAINWLLYSDNKHYKPQVLPFIDLQSISYAEYQDICRRYPHFFSDAELSSIILSELRQDPNLLPKWYKPKTKSVVENSCSLCIHVHQRMKISKPLQVLKINKRKDMKSVTQEFGFRFQQFTQIKLLSVNLNFGPDEISPKEFTLQFSLSRNVSVRQYSVSTTKRHNNYKIFFKSPLTIKSEDTLTLKFNFRRGLLANNIHVVWPMNVQHQKLNSESNNDVPSVNTLSSKLAFYLADDSNAKFIVSSFYFNICDNHFTFLSRKFLETRNLSIMTDLDPELKDASEFSGKFHVKEKIIDTKMDMDPEFKYTSEEVYGKIHVKEEIINATMDMDPKFKYTSEEISGKIHVKEEIIDTTMDMHPEFKYTSEKISGKVHVKKETFDTKMEISDDPQSWDNDVVSKELNTSLKMEDITFDTSSENQDSSFQIVAYDRMTQIKQEIMDLTDDL